MKKLSLNKGKWADTRWHSVEIYPYEYEDFSKILSHLCKELHIQVPSILAWIDGYIADIRVNNDVITLHLDNWTFSVATQNAELRDKIFDILKMLEI
ncbi:MAG: hypothetical protein HYZ21_08355 [Chloroflexi bacterium]|nr:hypothetical protein [Chloroflexota bacterium]